MKKKFILASVVATIAGATVVAIAQAGDAGHATDASAVNVAEAVTDWKSSDLGSASDAEVAVVDDLLAEATKGSLNAAGPKTGSLDASQARVAIQGTSGKVSVVVSEAGVCFATMADVSSGVTAVCSDKLHPTGVIWGMGVNRGVSQLAGVAADDVTRVDVLDKNGVASPATLRSNAFVWNGTTDARELRVFHGAVSETVSIR